MDVVLKYADEYMLDSVYATTGLARDDMCRQLISLLAIVNIGGLLVYTIPATLSYYFLFDKRLLNHPLILKNQVEREIRYALGSIPFMSLPTVSVFMFELRGYSKLYDDVHAYDWGWAVIAVQIVTFILFTDCGIYWIHRGLHHKLIYKYVHKDHHAWKIPTPFASHAFHPLDGFLQSCPYHIYPFLFPLHKYTYLALFVFVNVWTVSIHDGDYRVPDSLKPFVNGSAHHTDHHLFYNYNYGQFFTLWDRIGSSFKSPSAWQGDSPLANVLAGAGCKNGKPSTGKGD